MFKKGQKPGKAPEIDLEKEVKKEGKAGLIMKEVAKAAMKPKKGRKSKKDSEAGEDPMEEKSESKKKELSEQD